MRLAIIRQGYTPSGKVERFLENALEALLERNVAISLYARSWPQTKLQLIEPVICDPFFLGALWRDWGFAQAVCRTIGRSKANLVESHERLPCCDVYRAGNGVHAVWLEERRRGASAFDRLRLDLSPYNLYMLHAEKKMFASRWLRAVICNSKMVRDEIRDRFGLPESKLSVIYNAVDTDAFRPELRVDRSAILARHGISEAATVFLLGGSGYAHSGAATAIEALAELPAPAHLIIAGRDAHAERYRELAQSIGISDRVTMSDTESDPATYYGAADAFVLPTLYDPSPDTTLEAMACALPVVTSTKSGAAELLLEHDGGRVCPAGDVAGLAVQMRSLLDPSTRARLGANARRAVEPLTPAAITLQLVLLYRDLLAATVPAKAAPKSAGKDALDGSAATPTVPRSDAAPAPAADAPVPDSPEDVPASVAAAPAPATPPEPPAA